MDNLMQKQTSLEILNEKVSNMLQSYNALKNENDILRTEVVSIKGQMEMKDQEIEKLSDENALKDIEIEEIVSKIENILG